MRAPVVLALLVLGAVPAVHAQGPASLVGHWSWEALVDTEAVADGAMDVQRAPSGTLTGTALFGGDERPVRVLAVHGRAFRLEMVMPDGAVPVEGTLLADGTISGTWGYGDCSGRFTARKEGR